MNRRTPHRRISPRTVRRYRAIKNFLRRALGSSSQPDIKTNSSISESVLDLKQKIDGIEQQLNTVSKHCQDLATLESRLKLQDNLHSIKDTDTDSKVNKQIKNEILYNTSRDQCHKSVKHRSTPKLFIHDDEAGTNATLLNKMVGLNHSYNNQENKRNELYHGLDTIEENGKIMRKHKTNMASKTLPATQSTHSFNAPRIYTRHLDPGCTEEYSKMNRKNAKFFKTNVGITKLDIHKEQTCGDHRNHKNKYEHPDLDQDFIADIIKRQYKPIKLFGRRESDFSQFSAPVCRDQDFPIRERVLKDSDLCSCCHQQHMRHRHTRYMCSNDLSDMRSICDTRLYSSTKHKQRTNHKKHTNHFYNDSAMYDVIPVKEKSSPKTRRKFTEGNVRRDNYREVPPSPRTQRPRLNLQAQFHSDDDQDRIPLEKQLRYMKKFQRKSFIQNEDNVSKMSSEVFIHNKNYKCMLNSQMSTIPKPYNEECVGRMNNIHDQVMINNDTTLNTQTTDASADQTDKTLSEIKDILQSFLQEIKKESLQNDKLDNVPQLATPPNINEAQPHVKRNSFNNNNNFGHCALPPFMQSFPNSCCYPILPICPINCMQNGFVLPSPSYTCAACANHSKERTCDNNGFKNRNNSSEDANNETQKMIREIHNLISQNPNSIQRKEFPNNPTSFIKKENTNILTSRSAGSSSKASKHDAKVGTRKLKSHSKSCEAIGSRETTDTKHTTNVSYSDTVLEKGSGAEITTESASESEYSSESTYVDKTKGSKLKNILRSIGILKKNKTGGGKERTVSDSSMDITKPTQKSPFQSRPTPPFQQHIVNYNMHGQEYFYPPAAPPYQHQNEYVSHQPQFDPRTSYSPMNVSNKVKKSHGKHYQDQNVLAHCTSPHHMPVPYANYYDPHYHNVPPQVPVCLKEIEVKSIGTQSVRKISLLQKLTNKMQVPVQQAQESSPNQSSTRTSSKDKNAKDKSELPLFDWKKFHEKAMQKTTDPLKFSYKTQNRLAEGDNTMRKAMLKKLFYKRNPFSPRNLLVRTLLGKDKSSFGEPPKMYKPRMFL